MNRRAILSRVRAWPRQPPPVALIATVLAGLAATLYVRTLAYDFVNYDDPGYVVENPWVNGGLTPKSLIWAFTIHGPSMWVPLTWLSHQLVVTLGGLDPAWHHGANVLLHAGNAAMVFLAFRRLTNATWRPALMGLLLAVHPMHVESVAWVTERKDVLALAGVLATLWCYAGYARAPSVRSWWKVTGALALAVMAKPLAVTLPCLLLLLDGWPLRRLKLLDRTSWWPCLREKLPWFMGIAWASWMTVLCQQSIGAIGTLERFPVTVRLANVLTSYTFYLEKLIWPTNLAIPYPFPHTWPLSAIAGSAATLLLGTALVLRVATRAGWALTGWLWFLGSLVPMIGIVQAGLGGRADRYTYLPYLGLYLILAWSAAAAVRRWRRFAPALVVLGVLVIGWWTSLAWRQVPVWRSSETLFANTLAVTGLNHVAFNNLGIAAQKAGDLAKAEANYRDSIETRPDFAEAWNNLGVLQAGTGRLTEAQASFSEATRLRPEVGRPWVNLGWTWLEARDAVRAERYFRYALSLDDQQPMAHFQLGLARRAQGDLDSAATALRDALILQPNLADAWRILAEVLAERGDLPGAAAAWAHAAKIQPASAVTQWEAARAAGAAGDHDLQERSLFAAVKAQPDHYLALLELGRIQRERGNLTLASQLLLAALNQQSTPEVHFELGLIYQAVDDNATAAHAFREALRLRPDWPPALEKLRETESRRLSAE